LFKTGVPEGDVIRISMGAPTINLLSEVLLL
jgi:hypothetical protein